MPAWGGGVNFCTIRVLLECASFFVGFQWITYPELNTYKLLTKTESEFEMHEQNEKGSQQMEN